MAHRAPIVELADLTDIFDLRWAVLRPGRPREEAQYEQDGDAETFHLAARDPSGAAIGCATFLVSSLDGEPAWLLRGMATAPEHRGQGVGTSVLQAGLAEAHHRGGWTVWCKGRIAATSFYRRNGFVEVGPQVHGSPRGPHYLFVCRLS